MSFLDKAKDLIGQGVDKVGADKVGEGLDKAGEFADEKTGGKFSDQIDQGVETAKNEAEKLDGGN
ncbi:antitoxin [Nocardioides sp. NPDC057577]|uniref:antitoxin n=1 Tax=unclassified Nocardioides TaxID=2615069 RepID=UPI0008805447|nr:antitoxin [Nocardioides sp. YR527]SDL08294.1 MT0933-like antitoxin protein [Nocardioides sp. YR527]